MIKRRLRAIYGELALYHVGKERPAKALRYLRKMECLSPLTKVEQAFEATLLLIMHDFENSKKMFEFVAKTSSQASKDENYVRLYCQAHLHGMHGEIEKQGTTLVQAFKVHVAEGVLRWLPLRD